MQSTPKDLSVQSYLFPGMATSEIAASETADAVQLLSDGLPGKDSVTIPEARDLMCVSRRTVENWVLDGTLLATYANRYDAAQRKHARIVVRSNRAYNPNRTKFLTLAELRVKRSNVSGN